MPHGRERCEKYFVVFVGEIRTGVDANISSLKSCMNTFNSLLKTKFLRSFWLSILPYHNFSRPLFWLKNWIWHEKKKEVFEKRDSWAKLGQCKLIGHNKFWVLCWGAVHLQRLLDSSCFVPRRKTHWALAEGFVVWFRCQRFRTPPSSSLTPENVQNRTISGVRAHPSDYGVFSGGFDPPPVFREVIWPDTTSWQQFFSHWWRKTQLTEDLGTVCFVDFFHPFAKFRLGEAGVSGGEVQEPWREAPILNYCWKISEAHNGNFELRPEQVFLHRNTEENLGDVNIWKAVGTMLPDRQEKQSLTNSSFLSLSVSGQSSEDPQPVLSVWHPLSRNHQPLALQVFQDSIFTPTLLSCTCTLFRIIMKQERTH